MDSFDQWTNYSDEEIQALNWAEKCQLIKSDPVTCARYFDYRVQMFLHKVLLSEVGPIGKIVDYFYRVEFQQRGSPHVHMLVWIANAPNMATHCEQDIIQFVDTYVMTKKNPLVKYLVNYQTHRHARTCRKKGQDICRFGFPLPPMPQTVILKGIGNGNSKKTAGKHYKLIFTELEKMKTSESELNFSCFLSRLNLTFDEYIQAIRSSIKCGQSKLFLKRDLNEIRINSYNETLINVGKQIWISSSY